MTQSALISLDEPTPFTRRAIFAWAGGLSLYLLLTAWIYAHSPLELQQLVWVPLAHALVVSLVCLFTAVLIIGQAVACGRRGYLWLGGTYLYVAGILAAFPLFFPGAFRSDGPLIGGAQGAVTLFYSWHLAFLLGLLISSWFLWADQRRHRRPVLQQPPVVTVVIVLGLVAVTLFAAVAADSLLPALVDDSGRILGTGVALDRTILVLSVLVVVMTGSAARRGAQVQRWLFAVAVLLLGESVVNLAAAGRWTLGWYFDRIFGVLALSTLFIALLWILTGVNRRTNSLAVIDQLTGCESRAHFTRTMAREWSAARQHGRPVALLWIDIDGFKSVNDELGHPLGDQVLRIVVRRIQAQVRNSDHVGRVGGDEFGVFLSDNVTEDRAAEVAQRILTSLREPIALEGSTALLAGSIGVALSGDGAESTDELLRQGDLAMYAAKAAGGDRFRRFSRQLGDAAVDKARLRHDLGRAIRSGDFEMTYQPIVIPATGEVRGAEAQVLWRPGPEQVQASEFLPFAEQTGQVLQIGLIVRRILAAQAPALLDRLPADGFLSFNLSAKELADRTLVSGYTDGPLGAFSSRLIIEVTESLEFQTLSEVQRNLARLRSCGYRVAVDDFGAGFSNFSRLEELDPRFLKVDRSLVERAGRQVEGGVSFLSAAVTIAESLRCHVVAVGVETEPEHDIVRLLNVEYAQGRRYGGPLLLDEFPVLTAGG